ncbi:hypothetical protein AC249_AIPGENE23033 [Exaiptasia diaphana]|nr:hypothetical protein AC249_AIPGENE23033 [Exaiptasia diaphana]
MQKKKEGHARYDGISTFTAYEPTTSFNSDDHPLFIRFLYAGFYCTASLVPTANQFKQPQLHPFPVSYRLLVHPVTTTTCTRQSTVSRTMLVGQQNLHTPQILEWNKPRNCSQSTISGRSRSNASTFIALCLGNLIHKNHLQPPVNGNLDNNSLVCMKEAIIAGYNIYDDIFENDPVNVTVEEADEIAGSECHVQMLEQQLDVFGRDPIGQVATAFKDLRDSQRPMCSVVISDERSFLFVVGLKASWLARMMFATWKSLLQRTSITPVVYSHT